MHTRKNKRKIFTKQFESGSQINYNKQCEVNNANRFQQILQTEYFTA